MQNVFCNKNEIRKGETDKNLDSIGKKHYNKASSNLLEEKKYKEIKTMKIKKITTALLSGVLCTSLALTGCGNKTVDPDAVVATLNGKEIKLGLANFIAQYNAVTYDAYYSAYMGGPQMWTQDYSGEGKTMEDNVKEQVMDTIETNYLLEEHMADYNVEITEDELAAMREAAANFMESNDPAAIERMTATEDIVTEMLRLDTIQKKMYNAIIADVDTEVSDEEAAQRTFSYYNITLPENGTESADATEAVAEELSTEEQKAELEDYATQVAGAAKEDFDAVADTYALSESTYSYGSDEDSFAKEVIDEADKLKEGEVSDVIETENGQYYVIRLDSEFDETATENKKQEIVSERQADHYKEVCDGYKKDADWSIKKSVWKNVTFTGNQYTIKTNDTETEAVENTEVSVEPVENTESVLDTETATETVAPEDTELVQ